MSNDNEERQNITETDDGLRNLMAACQGGEDDQFGKSSAPDALPGIEICVSQGDDEDQKPLIVQEFSSSSTNSTTWSKKPKRGQKRGEHIFAAEDLELFAKPLKSGWTREVVWRNTVNSRSTVDVYYSPPIGRRLRSLPEVMTYLTENNVVDLTGDNFTFYRSVLNLPNEIERDAYVTGTKLSGNFTANKTKTTNGSIQKDTNVDTSAESILSSISKTSSSPTMDTSSRPESSASEDRDSSSAVLASDRSKRQCKRPNESESGSDTTVASNSSKKRKKMPAIVTGDSHSSESESESESSILSTPKVNANINDKDQSESESESKLFDEMPTDVLKTKKRVKKFKIPFSRKRTPFSVVTNNVKTETEENEQDFKISTTTVEDIVSTSSPPPPCPSHGCDIAVSPYSTICAKCLMGFHIRCASERGKVFNNKQEIYFICNNCYEKWPTMDSVENGAHYDVEIIDELPATSSSPAEKASLEADKMSTEQGDANWMSDVCVYFQLLKLIFKHLSVIDLIRAKRVCKTWYDIAGFPEFWRFASLNKCQILDWSKANPFFRQHHVQTLDFFGVRTTVKAFGEALKEMDFITGFHFGCIVPYVLTSLKDSPRVLKQMEYLKATITEQRKPDTIMDVEVDFELFKDMCRLKFLRMQCARNFLFRMQNVDCLGCCEQLTTLILFDIKTDNEYDFLFLKRLRLLQTLHIGYCISWTGKTFEIVSGLKNLERLRLEGGSQSCSSYLLQTLISLPRLQYLCLFKFPITKILMDIVAKKKLNNFTLWPDFNKSNSISSWNIIVDGLDGFKNCLKSFTLGVLSKSVTLVNTPEMTQFAMPDLSEQSTHNSPTVRFGLADETRGLSVKRINIDEFVNYAKRFIPVVEYKYFKDESVTSSRS